MQQHGINWWRSPAESPDLNPIENVWNEMKHDNRTRVRPRTKDEFEKGLHEFWETVTPEKCERYINHIHKVIPAIIAKNGDVSGF